jgi:hypothetical protein
MEPIHKEAQAGLKYPGDFGAGGGRVTSQLKDLFALCPLFHTGILAENDRKAQGQGPSHEEICLFMRAEFPSR